MRISNLTGVDAADLTKLAEVTSRAGLRVYVTTTELAAMLGVSTDTVKRRLNAQRGSLATAHLARRAERWEWDTSLLPIPCGDTWRSRPAEWNLITVLRWLAARPMQRRV